MASRTKNQPEPSGPSAVYFPKKKQDMSKYKRLLDHLPDTEIEPEFQRSIITGFPNPQNHPEDLLLAARAVLRYNRAAEHDGAVALTLHFIGFFHKCGNQYTPHSCVHLFEIASIRIKSKYKVLVLCKMGNSGRSADAIVNCRIISKDAVRIGQILYRNYMLSVVAFDPECTCDFRTELKDEFPPFYPGLSPSQGYQFTYYAFTTNLGRKYYHEVSRYYHEHIRNHDGVFDFGQLPYELREGAQASVKDLMPVIHAMMFVPIMDPNRSTERFPYVRGIIVHNKPFPWIGKGVGRIVWKSQILRFIHLSRVQMNGDKQIGAIGDGLQANPTIPCVYYNFENNYNVANDGMSFLIALQNVTAKIFFLSVAQCYIGDVKPLADALGYNENLRYIKYLYFNGNGLDYKYAKPLISYLELRGKDVANNPIVRFGVGGDDRTIEAVFECLQTYPQPIEELSVAGTRMGKTGAQALIRYVKQTRTMRVLDLSGCGMEPEYTQWVLRAMSENQVVGPLRVRLNEQKLTGERLMSIAKGFLMSNLDRWESIEFRNNGFGVFELQFVISFLWRMKNLEEVDFSENFTKGMHDIGKELGEGLLLIPNLKRIRMAGNGRSSALGKQGCVFLQKLLESGRSFEELDMSGNKMGDEGYELMLRLLSQCDEMKELLVDGNEPERIQTIARMVDVVEKKPNLTFFVFPYYDAMKYLRERSGERVNVERYQTTSLRMKCDRALNDRRHALGMPSLLPFHAVPELGQLVDEISGVGGSMEKCLNGVETGIHGGITKDIRVTLPYLNEGQDITEGGTCREIDGPLQPEYHSQFINVRIDEHTYEVPDIPLDLDESVIADHSKKTKKRRHRSSHRKDTAGDETPKKKGKKSPRRDSSDDEDETPKKKGKKSPRRDTSDDEEESPKKPKRKNTVQTDSESNDEEETRRSRKTPTPAARKSSRASKKPETSSDDESSEETKPKASSRRSGRDQIEPKLSSRKLKPAEDDPAPRSSRGRSPAPRKAQSSSDDSDTPEDPPKKQSRPAASPSRRARDLSESSEDERAKSRSTKSSRARKESPPPDPRRSPRKPSPDRFSAFQDSSDDGVIDIPMSSSQFNGRDDSSDEFANFEPEGKSSKRQRPPPPLKRGHK